MALAPQETAVAKFYKVLSPSTFHLFNSSDQDKVRRIVQQLINGNEQAEHEAREYLLGLQEQYYPFLAVCYQARNHSLTLKNLSNVFLPFAVAIAGNFRSRGPFDYAQNSTEMVLLELLILCFLILYAIYESYVLGNYLIQLAQTKHDVLNDIILLATDSQNTIADKVRAFQSMFFEVVPAQQSGLSLNVDCLITHNISKLDASELLDLYKRIFPDNILQLDNVPQLIR